MVPDADYLYACDQKWWQVHLDRVRETFSGELYTQYSTRDEYDWAVERGIVPIEGCDLPGLGMKRIHWNSNSGAQAMNLAYLKGAGSIVMLGYDMQGRHWFGDHPEPLHNGNYSGFVDRFSQLAIDLKSEGVMVVNCSRETALTQFPRASLESVLCGL